AILVEVACTHALKLAAGRRKNGRDGSRAPQDTWLPQLKALSSRAPAQLQQWALSGNPVGRHVFFDQAKKRLLAKSHGLYPAPERILQVVRHGLEQGFAAGLAAEAQAFGELLQTPESAALMGIFHGQQALKKASGTDDPTAQPRPLERVAVLGAGLMGAGIAYVSAAQAGLEVRLRDMKDDALLRGMGQIRGILEGRKRRGRLQGPELERIMAHIGPSTDVQHIAHADIVIEAVFEDLELKRKVLREVEACTRPDTIFASNTSALPISDIAAASAHPETVIGMHYFSPVEKMPLLEVITTEHTAPWVTATAVQLGKKQGKTVIVVRDGVGFYTTRIVMPFMNEAAYLLAEGVPVEEIDAALTAFGFPVGPLKLTDEVGIDVGQKVSHIMHEAFGERAKPAPLLQRLIDDKRFGRKNGRGFYRYEAGARGVDESIYTLLDQAPQPGRIRAEQIAERCVLQMVNEALRCLHEGILRQVQDGDIGAVFGLGFPPYLGGPLRYVDSRGVATILRRLETLEASHGPRFQPAPLLRELAQQGLRLYPATGAMPSHNPHSPAQGALRA
ncbi:MAG: 3-hydroxyacyl-CoA dehydrogenase NAD-binding domain-containing protein, partial [Polyangiales bacterium]